MDTHLSQKCNNPDDIEKGVVEEAFERVEFPVYFPRVDFVEECHHDEGVEYNGKVLGRN